MGADLRAVVLGAGFAGQGHAEALRSCGVEIVAITGRTPTVVQAVARRMAIPEATTDWRKAIIRHRPQIVAVATPGGTHVAMAGTALHYECHVLIDKPLATTARAAKQLWLRSETAGVCTAYAATASYHPAVLYARELVQAGAIGPVLEVECVSHYHWPKLTSFGWAHRLETGGGRLNNNFSHKLAIVLAVTGGTVLAATGESRNDLHRAPVGPRSHDFRTFTQAALTPAAAARCRWREVDSDWAYSALLRVGPAGSEKSAGISALFRHSALRRGKVGDYVAFYGETGTIHIDGAYAQGALHLGQGSKLWKSRPIPQRIHRQLPPIEDNTQRNWTQLAREFVADIRGQGDSGYLKFVDGYRFQQVIDVVRQGRGWTAFGPSVSD